MFVSHFLLCLGIALSTEAASLSQKRSWSTPVHACIWRHNDEVVNDVTLEECQEKCDSATSFFCRSVEHAMTGVFAKTCWMSTKTSQDATNFQKPCSGLFSNLLFSENIGTAATTDDLLNTENSVVGETDDWSCEDCARGSTALISHLTSSSSLEDQISLLVSAMCPNHTDPDPASCRTTLPIFWTNIGIKIWAGFWPYICLDKSCSSSSEVSHSVSELSCKACVARVNGHLELLDAPTTINLALGALHNFCADEDDISECKTVGKWLYPDATVALKTSLSRGWINDICQRSLGCI